MPKNLGTAQEVSFSADPALGVTRRFPPPWSVEEKCQLASSRGHDGQALAYANIAKLPELLRQPKPPRSHDVRFRG
jgi:hypothetical protein